MGEDMEQCGAVNGSDLNNDDSIGSTPDHLRDSFSQASSTA